MVVLDGLFWGSQCLHPVGLDGSRCQQHQVKVVLFMPLGGSGARLGSPGQSGCWGLCGISDGGPTVLGASGLWHWVTNESVGVGWSWSEKKGRGAKPESSHASEVQFPSLRG